MKPKIAELDGIRGIAILLVLLCHMCMDEPFSEARVVLFHGRLGVDLFFVLSGFLITGILLDSKGQQDAIKNFYIRRILRIWPVYFLTLLVLFVLSTRLLPTTASPWRYILFVQNLSGSQNEGPFLQPFWSLAVEEQFYLVWPWIVFRLSAKALSRVCVALFVSALLLRILFNLSGVSQEIIYTSTLCRTDAIAAGSFVAVLVRNRHFPLIRLRGAMVVILAAALALSLMAQDRTWVHQFGGSFAALLFSLTIFATWQHRGGDVSVLKLLRSRILTYIGQISFTLYLINFPIYTLAHGRLVTSLLPSTTHPVLASTLATILGNGVLFLVAGCSWKFFEKPILTFKHRVASAPLTTRFAAGD